MKVIKVENLSKLYDLGQVGTGTISKDLNRWWAKVRGQNDPYARIGHTNDRTKKAGKDDSVWALKDINFSVNQGEVVGIIGRNGAGKSTLLKIISRITTPTTGSIKIKGRIASLLEVGTGFHPEMTGRENVFMNGTLLGMTRREIQSKLEEIIDFSGVEMYVDTPVKRYSSGMQVRLAFAVAAFLEPEILIVDEVLAVGDAEFQKKAIGRMQEVSKGDGRTVLFVSHNMAAVQKLCNKSILLKNGYLVESDDTDIVIGKYLESSSNPVSEYFFSGERKGSQLAFISKVAIVNVDGSLVTEIPIGKPWSVKIYFTVNQRADNLIIGLGMLDSHDSPVRTSWQHSNSYSPGTYVATFIEENIFFSVGSYRLLAGISQGSVSIEYIDQDMWIKFSDVVEHQDKTVVNNQNGLFVNQMKMYVEEYN